MHPAQKIELADEIFAQQPSLLASILVLPQMGVNMLQLEVPLHILLVTVNVLVAFFIADSFSSKWVGLRELLAST